MKNLFFSLLLINVFILIISISGCGEGKRSESNSIIFDARFDDDNHNLQNKLGRSFFAVYDKSAFNEYISIDSSVVALDSVAPQTDSAATLFISIAPNERKVEMDTSEYVVLYNRESKINTIIRKRDNDTLLNGWVSKYRGLYYVSEPYKNGTYKIFAINIEKKTIKGLIGSSWQDFNLVMIIDSSLYQPLIIDHDSIQYKLRVDKKLLRGFYENEVKSAVGLNIIKRPEQSAIKPFAIAKKTVNIKKPSNKEDIKITIYPNPVATSCTVSFSKTANYKTQIFNINQHLIQSGQINGNETSIDVNALENGIYFLIATNTATGLRLTSRFIVQH